LAIVWAVVSIMKLSEDLWGALLMWQAQS
jgi:hypothetical protein